MVVLSQGLIMEKVLNYWSGVHGGKVLGSMLW